MGGQYESRVLRGLCHWIHEPNTEKMLEDLLQEDPYTHAKFEDLIEAAGESGGLPAAGHTSGPDYRAPLDFPPPNYPNPPWLGELKAKGKKRKGGRSGLDWRLYFGEPIEREDHVVSSGLHYKVYEDSSLESKKKERDAIKKAMTRFKGWSNRHGCTWHPFEA